jgi:hypothetical protein
MLAHKTAAPDAERFEAPASPAAEPAPVWAASDQDVAAVSPVHALQSRLARELDGERRPRFGLVRPLIIAANMACWWGIISLGVSVAHHWPFH